MNDKYTILIVDDNEISRGTLKACFYNTYNCIEAENGAQAISMLKNSTKVDIIMLDFFMPKMNGLEFLKTIKADKKLCNIPVIMCTVEDSEAIEVEALRLGAEDYIIKPYRSMAVKQKVKHTLKRINDAALIERDQKVIARLESTQDELEAAHLRLKAITNNIPGAVTSYDVDSNGKIHLRYVSDGCEKIFGFTSKRLLERLKDDVFYDAHPFDKQKIYEKMVNSVNNSTPESYTYRSLCRDGSYRWVTLNVSPVESQGIKRFYGVWSDINEIVENERALRLSNESFNMLLNESKTVIYDINFENSVMKLSYVDMNGNRHTKDIKAGFMNGSPMIHPDDKEKVSETYRKSSKMVTSGHCQYRADYYNTGYEWYMLSYRSFADANGKVYRLFGKAENIQQQKELEARYEEELEKRSSLQANCLAIFSLNLSRKTLSAYESNGIGHKPPKVGISIKDAIEYISLQITNKKEQIEFCKTFDEQRLLELMRSGEQRVQVDYRRDNGYGEVKWMRSVGNLMINPSTNEMLVFVYTYDIHNAKMHEAVMKSVIAQDYEAIILINAKRNTSKTIGVGNGYDDVYYDTIEDYDKTVQEYLDNHCVNRQLSQVKNALLLKTIVHKLQKQKEYSFVYSIRLNGGKVRREKVSFFYIDRENDLIVETRINITELYEAEVEKNRQLQQALSAAEQASRAKTEFLSRMSHDIRTPMNAIIGMTELARDENNLPKTAEYLRNINESSQFLLGLINDILDLSKIESGQIELYPEPFTKAEFERGVNTVIRPLMDAKHINFVFDIRSGADCFYVDKLRYNQIFFNLLTNAAKFTPEGGNVEFVSEEITDDNGNKGCRTYIRDNGIGMSKEFLPHIFESFTQEKTNITSQLQGTGLGLPIVRSLVDAMGGKISVISEKGKGTEYIIDMFLPIGKPDKIQQKETKHIKTSLKNRHIMLAEDNNLNIVVAKRLLEREGCIVDVAKNGLEAVNMFKSSQCGCFDAILMDVRMPVMNGLDATREIRKLDKADAKSIPIIAMTADAFAQDRKGTLESGMNAHLSKPIVPQLLYDTLNQYIVKK